MKKYTRKIKSVFKRYEYNSIGIYYLYTNIFPTNVNSDYLYFASRRNRKYEEHFPVLVQCVCVTGRMCQCVFFKCLVRSRSWSKNTPSVHTGMRFKAERVGPGRN